MLAVENGAVRFRRPHCSGEVGCHGRRAVAGMEVVRPSWMRLV